MDPATRDRLLELNRLFYAVVAEPFHETRRGWTPGKAKLLDYVPTRRPLRVADIGCGNGRFAVMLDSLGTPVAYTGVDSSTELLALARQHTANLVHVTVQLVQADLAKPGWVACLGDPAPRFDLVVCLATLQHLPGYSLRAQAMRSLASLLDEEGLLAVSAWQFLESDRLAAKQIDWAQAGLSAADVEPGDALLPWKQGAFAIRYVHQIDQAEMERLAAGAGLEIRVVYRADGKEGNLNLYALMRRQRRTDSRIPTTTARHTDEQR